jgi:biotin carboxyl carrier protein
MKHRIAVVADKRIEVSWTETETTIEANVDGRSYRLEKRRVSEGILWLGRDGLSVDAFVTPRENGYEVVIRGNRTFIEFEDSRRKRHRHSGAQEGTVSVRAPMPGKIVRVLQAEGMDVEAHQGIVVMEAMKMQNEIRTPKRGRIAKLSVAEGDAVNLGDLIAQVE